MPVLSEASVRRALQVGAYAGVWLTLWAGISLLIFSSSHRDIEVASHEATLRADFSGHVVLRTGPILPDLRAPTGSAFGVEVVLGKTDTSTLEDLTARYAAIASQPEGQIAVMQRAVTSMAVTSLVQGAALATVPLLVWGAIGRTRRAELVRGLPTWRGAVAVATVAGVVVAVAVPLAWGDGDPDDLEWSALSAYVGDSVDLPPQAQGVEITTNATVDEGRRLVFSGVDSYQQGEAFYSQAAEDAEDLELRQPEEDETVAVLVSDRHDNIGMDAVARAIGDTAGATAVLNAGDDTSTGARWEAFSLDSVAAAFEDYDRWAVAGNHDHGDFVRNHLEDLGWTYFDDEVVDGPGGSRILGLDDPRSSGLGNWRDESGLTFSEVRDRVTESVCASDEDGDRVNTLLVHDANIAKGALEEGCVDLVVGGHVHVESGPTPVLGANAATGYTYTVGTTGGAAYAIAIGSKLRRAANVALITYRDGRPVGLQSVTLQTNGRYDVGEWTQLIYGDEEPDEIEQPSDVPPVEQSTETDPVDPVDPLDSPTDP